MANRSSKPGTGDNVNRWEGDNPGGFPGWNVPITSTGRVVDGFGCHKTNWVLLRSNRSAANAIVLFSYVECRNREAQPLESERYRLYEILLYEILKSGAN